MFDIPVAVIIFNRPQCTERLLAALRPIQPAKLHIIADAPRHTHPADAELCAKTRSLLEHGIDWNCQIARDYAPENLGCGRRPATGISRVFNAESMAIILEDDCLPGADFFSFCRELLLRYEHDSRVMMISGNRHFSTSIDIPSSYSFTRYTQTWGWATWRRAWQHFDYDMKNWPALRNQPAFTGNFVVDKDQRHWQRHFDTCHQDQAKHYWDYQWTWSCLSQGGLCAVPAGNLVSNIGFDAQATHTFDPGNDFFNLPAEPLHFPLHHPDAIASHPQIDRSLMDRVFHPTFRVRARRKIRRILGKVLNT